MFALSLQGSYFQMDDELLIDLVERYPIIYDKKHVSFRNKDKKDRVWQTIARHMETDDNTVRRRWINLRERFSKEIRHPQPVQWEPDNELPDMPPPQRWALFDRLSFLKYHIIQRPTRQGSLTNKIIRPKLEDSSFRLDPLDLVDTETKMELPTPPKRHSPSMHEQRSPSRSSSRSRSRSPTPPQVSPSPTRRAPSRAAALNSHQSQVFTTIPSATAAYRQSKRRALDDGSVDGAMLEAANLFKEIYEQKAHAPAIDPEISGFTTMIGAMIAKFKAKRRFAVIQRCTEVVMAAALEEEDEQFYK